MKKIILIVAICLSGCTTIHFDRDSAVKGQVSAPLWHHIGVISLVEFSAPVNLDDQCGEKEWDSVQTEQNFLNVLASMVGSAVIPALWSPKSVEVTCK